MGGFAWVTLATNDSYSLGALVLAHSLRRVGTKHDLAVLVTPGVTQVMRDKLATVFTLVQEVNVLDSKDEANLALLARPELGITFTKLHCWRLTQYEKCVFVDADALVMRNCDELFEREELSAAPDVGWPDCFNSGVFVFKPSQQTFASITAFAASKGSFDGGDQGLLNLYFSDWAHKDISKHLPFIYNMCSTATYSYLPAYKQFGDDVRIIHFIGATKPWLQYFDTQTGVVQPPSGSNHLQPLLQHWWNIFCENVHPKLSPVMASSTLASIWHKFTPSPPSTFVPSYPIYHYSNHVTNDNYRPPTSPNAPPKEPDFSEFKDPWENYQPEKSDRQGHQNQQYYDSGNKEYHYQPPQQQHYEYHQPQAQNHHVRYYHEQHHSSPQHHHQSSSEHHHHNEHQHNVEKHQYQSHQQESPPQHHIQNHHHQDSHKSPPHQETHPENYQHRHYERNHDHHHNSAQHHYEHHEGHNDGHQHQHEGHQHQHHEIHHYNQDHNHEQQYHNQHHEQQYHNQHHEQHQNNNGQHEQHQHNNEHHEQHQHNNEHHEQHQHNNHHQEHNHQHYHHHEHDKHQHHENQNEQHGMFQHSEHHHERERGNDHLNINEKQAQNWNSEHNHGQNDQHIEHDKQTDEQTHESHIPGEPFTEPHKVATQTEQSVDIPGQLESEDAGLAGALAKMTLGEVRSPEQAALEEHMRRQGWEQGQIDYMGRDSFDNIWKKICDTMSQGSAEEPSPSKETPTEEPIATSPVPAPTPAPEPLAAPVAEQPISQLPIEAASEQSVTSELPSEAVPEQSTTSDLPAEAAPAQFPIPEPSTETLAQQLPLSAELPPQEVLPQPFAEAEAVKEPAIKESVKLTDTAPVQVQAEEPVSTKPAPVQVQAEEPVSTEPAPVEVQAEEPVSTEPAPVQVQAEEPSSTEPVPFTNATEFTEPISTAPSSTGIVLETEPALAAIPSETFTTPEATDSPAPEQPTQLPENLNLPTEISVELGVVEEPVIVPAKATTLAEDPVSASEIESLPATESTAPESVSEIPSESASATEVTTTTETAEPVPVSEDIPEVSAASEPLRLENLQPRETPAAVSEFAPESPVPIQVAESVLQAEPKESVSEEPKPITEEAISSTVSPVQESATAVSETLIEPKEETKPVESAAVVSDGKIDNGIDTITEGVAATQISEEPLAQPELQEPEAEPTIPGPVVETKKVEAPVEEPIAKVHKVSPLSVASETPETELQSAIEPEAKKAEEVQLEAESVLVVPTTESEIEEAEASPEEPSSPVSESPKSQSSTPPESPSTEGPVRPIRSKETKIPSTPTVTEATPPTSPPIGAVGSLETAPKVVKKVIKKTVKKEPVEGEPAEKAEGEGSGKKVVKKVIKKVIKKPKEATEESPEGSGSTEKTKKVVRVVKKIVKPSESLDVDKSVPETPPAGSSEVPVPPKRKVRTTTTTKTTTVTKSVPEP